MQLRHLRTFLIRTESYRDRIYIREVATQQPMLLLIYNTRFIRRKQKHTQEGPPGGLPRPGVLVVWCGGVLLSHTLSGAVPSPCQALASGFGMGPGVSPGPWPPQILGYRPGNRGFPPACGGSGTGQWTRLLLTDRARVRTVLPVRLRGALPGPAPHASRACGCGLPLDH